MKNTKIIIFSFLLLAFVSFQNPQSDACRVTYMVNYFFVDIKLTIEGGVGYLAFKGMKRGDDLTKKHRPYSNKKHKPYSYKIQSNIDTAKLEQLNRLINELNLEELGNYKPPTYYHANDGDYTTSLIVENNGNVYKTAYYDYGSPIIEIASLDSLIKVIVKDLENIHYSSKKKRAKH